ncbi:MAG: zinc dependent phospholipase C family protein [Candidatus Binataceae bacterium]
MIIVGVIAFVIGFIALSPQPAFAWGPITHIALGVRVLATVSTLEQPLQAILLSMPDAFLYGSLAPDIVQGRRFQSRLRRHSHNWSTGFGLLSAARGSEEQAFALGYLAHLGADVVAHNFYLPTRWIGHFSSAIASHILSEARFDSMHDASHRETLMKLMAIDFSALDMTLSRQIDSPLLPFRAQKRIFEGGMRRIMEWNRVILAIGRVKAADHQDAEVFCSASCSAIYGLLRDGDEAPACRFDPMGQRALRNAQRARRTLQRLARMAPETKRAARQLANTTVDELRTHLRQVPFGGPSKPS